VDSWFDNYVGVVSLVRVMNGTLGRGEKIRVMSTGRSHSVDKLGRFTPKPIALESLSAGEVDSSSPVSVRSMAPPSATPSHSMRARARRHCRLQADPAARVCGRVSINAEDYENFRDALAKLKLNDSALHYEPNHRPRWASAFVAVSWACCTWISSRSGSSASIRSSSSPARRP